MGATLLGGLPVVYICENNLYGMSVPFHQRCVEMAGQASNIEDVAERAVAYRMPSEIVDGQDALAVRAAVKRAVDRARTAGCPTLIEAKTYRYYGHSFSDQRAYRTRDEERAWRERDPIELFSRRLVDAGGVTAEEADGVRSAARETIEAATRFAQESPLPDVSELYDNVYVEPDAAERQAQVESEEALRAKIHPAEDALRAKFRASAGADFRSVLPKVGKEETEAIEREHGVRV